MVSVSHLSRKLSAFVDVRSSPVHRYCPHFFLTIKLNECLSLALCINALDRFLRLDQDALPRRPRAR